MDTVLARLPAPEVVAAELQTILASKRFLNAEKQGRFLAFVVNETLAGRQKDLKESILAIEVYERRKDYDPKIDAIVRVEAARLRNKLEQYYANEGRNDTVRIGIPKGSYAPVFSVPGAPKQQPRRSTLAARLLVAASICMIAAWSLPFRTVSSSSGDFSVVVIPTQNLTADSSLNPFCASLAEQLLTKLSSIPGLVVTGPKPASPGPRTQQPEHATLETSLHRSGSRLQITFKLIGTTEDKPILAANTYTAEPGESDRFPDAASDLLARTIGLNFGGPSDAAFRRRQHHPDASQFYGKGREAWRSTRTRGAQNAAALFEKAIAIDPANAEAHAWLATTAWFLADREEGNYSRRLAQARAAAARAIALDDRVAEAHATLGNIFLFADASLPDAERELRRAVELEPGEPARTRWYTLVASMRGHQKQAADELGYARLLNPESEYLQADSGRVALELGQWQHAERFSKRALELAPRFRLAQFNLGRIYEHRRQFDLALQSYHACGSGMIWDIDCEAAAVAVQALSGDRKAAEAAPRSPTWTGRALVWLRLGNAEKAIKAFQEACKRHERSFSLAWYDERFSQVRQEKRFREIWERSGTQLFQD